MEDLGGSFVSSLAAAMVKAHEHAQNQIESDSEHWLAPTRIRLEVEVEVHNDGTIVPKHKGNGRLRVESARTSVRESQRLTIESNNKLLDRRLTGERGAKDG